MSERYDDYIIHYPFESECWSITIQARSFEDAEARRKAIGWGEVRGKMLGITLPGWTPAWAASLYCRYLNWRDRKS